MKLPFAKAASLFLALALTSWPCLPQTDAGDEWTSKAYAAALEDLFPVRHADGDFIAVRAHQNGGYDVPEFSFILADTQDSHATYAILRETQGASIYHQLTILHAKDPAKSFAEVKADLKIQTWNLSLSQCPAVAAQYKAFENITFVRPHDDDPVSEHPILYEINESVGGGDSQVVEFIESRAIPRWANETRKALDSCAASAQPGRQMNPQYGYCGRGRGACYTFCPVASAFVFVSGSGELTGAK
jgi:hypothetical protein